MPTPRSRIPASDARQRGRCVGGASRPAARRRTRRPRRTTPSRCAQRRHRERRARDHAAPDGLGRAHGSGRRTSRRARPRVLARRGARAGGIGPSGAGLLLRRRIHDRRDRLGLLGRPLPCESAGCGDRDRRSRLRPRTRAAIPRATGAVLVGLRMDQRPRRGAGGVTGADSRGRSIVGRRPRRGRDTHEPRSLSASDSPAAAGEPCAGSDHGARRHARHRCAHAGSDRARGRPHPGAAVPRRRLRSRPASPTPHRCGPRRTSGSPQHSSSPPSSIPCAATERPTPERSPRQVFP